MVSSELEDLRLSIKGLPDEELLKMVGVERSEYRPEALMYAQEELARRKLRVPKDVDSAAESERIDSSSAGAASKKPDPFAGFSVLSKLLFVGSVLYSGISRIQQRGTNMGMRFSPTLAVGLLSAMFWSLAWDVRGKSKPQEGGVGTQWPKRIVLLAAIFSGVTLLLAWWELPW